MKNIIFILLLSGILSLSHPIHISVTNIDYSLDKKKINISFRLFLDDFDKIVSEKYGIELNIGKKNEHKNSNKYINKYIYENFLIKLNEKDVNSKKIVFNKRKIEDITIWLYYEIDYKTKLKNIEITNTLMTDLYKDQKNLLIFTYKNIQKALTFNRKNTLEKINLK